MKNGGRRLSQPPRDTNNNFYLSKGKVDAHIDFSSLASSHRHSCQLQLRRCSEDIRWLEGFVLPFGCRSLEWFSKLS